MLIGKVVNREYARFKTEKCIFEFTQRNYFLNLIYKIQELCMPTYGYSDKMLFLQSSCWERKRRAEISAKVQPPRKNTSTTLGASFCDNWLLMDPPVNEPCRERMKECYTTLNTLLDILASIVATVVITAIVWVYRHISSYGCMHLSTS
jgi:hypothetical protein